MKHIRRILVALALVLSIACGVFAGVQTTLAYISAQSQVVLNVFVPGEIPAVPEGSVTVQVNKQVLCSGNQTIGPEGFIFELTCNQTGEKYQLVSDAAGHAALNLTYTAEDAGSAFTYTLKEVNDGRTHIDYDTSVHILAVNVTLDEASDTLVTTATMDGVTAAVPTAQFVNQYSPTPVIPPLGDEMNLPLYALLLALSAVGLIIVARKRLN